MRKHRFYGVSIAVLIATTPFHQWPTSAGHSSSSDHRTTTFRLTSAKLPTGPVAVAVEADVTLFAPPPSASPRAIEAPWARTNFLAGRIAPTAPTVAASKSPQAQPLAWHAPPPPVTVAPPRPAPTVVGPRIPSVAAASAGPGSGSSGVWAELRRCESGGNYAEDTGNGYYGAYQFSLGTWRGLGLAGLPSQAPPAAQDQAAQRLQARSGWGQWPSCARRLGLL